MKRRLSEREADSRHSTRTGLLRLLSRINKGNATLFVIITLFTVMVASASGRLTVLSVSLVRNANDFLYVTIKNSTRQSAMVVLEFSCQHDMEVILDLNGFELETYKRSGIWYVRMEDNRCIEVHVCSLCLSGAH